ncbi:hypothetical protein FPSE_06816 [Fusarium pseudograminearum CS3096]|uniref:Nucleotidyl transferase AbiEii/AbiGii toxin family protein n=1 Tax=Fusarium pseudograminearum (strain CS3096) TaxID=1028729 RepID=K3VIM8_FUSPC|nr:hypothetical protein FPSE_06816 [Fusarium pseudograminearum CS3096]EKJ73028.1 hypothetical protein FPSE_06816 [Fusarium pseudograminearum CS3096]KAF0641051.1 hypothetical protein FPSE5266_06816 [Fusarium pseudograminearum]
MTDHYSKMPTLANMKEAAKAFSRILTEHNIEHAFIGGFALQMLGNVRETFDIDVEVDMDIEDFRGRIVKILSATDPRFVFSNLKIFFRPGGQGSPIPIETLARGMLGLPRQFSILCPGDGSVPILEPGVLILTKMKRATQYIGSTRPQSVLKYGGDLQGILHLLAWLRNRNKKIDFVAYDAASPERLYDAVRNMRNHWARLGQSNNVGMLDSALKPSDKAKVE